jgi:hypothetical protein
MRRALLVIALFVAAIGAAHGQVVGAAARVNGVEIGLFRLERHFDDFLKARARNLATIRNPEVFKRLKREALDQLIDHEVLWQEAQRRAASVPPDAVKQARASVAAGFGSEEAFQRRIRDAGFDEASYADYLKRQIAIGRTLDELVGEIRVSDEDVQSFMAENAARFAAMPDSDALSAAEQLLLRLRRDEAARKAVAGLRDHALIEVLVHF